MCFLREKPSSFLVLTALILVFFSLSSSTGAAGNGVVSDTQRINGDNATNLVLAKGITHRKDPLDNGKYYTGGWNITDQHYIASVVYSGTPLFLIAIIWFVGFGLFLLLACMYVCCCGRRKYGYSQFAYALSLVLLLLFTIAAIIGSIVLYTGQGKFHDSTTSTLDFVLSQADSTVENLRNVSSYLSSAKSIGVNQVSLPQQLQNSIDNVNNLITSAATTLDSATRNNKDDIFRYLDAVRLILIIVAAVMLTLAFLGFLLSITGVQCLVYFFVIVGWILITVTFILCGIFLVLHNMMGDTCVAMNDWVENPTAHTALDHIIPCVDSATSLQALTQSKEVTFQMVNIVNGIISNLSNVNFPPNAAPLYYNQSGPLVPLLCNPNQTTCSSSEVNLSNATQIWRDYECQVSSSNICTSVGRLTPGLYDQMSGVVNVSYGLNHYGQFLSDLVDCTFVRDTFVEIGRSHCPDLREYSRWVYIGLVMVSVAVMLSLILWVLYARERRHRKYTKLVDSNERKGRV